MNNEEKNKNEERLSLPGFVPLQELQKMAQEKIKQKREAINVNLNKDKLVIDKKIYNKYQIRKDTYFYIKFGIYFTQQQQQTLHLVQYDKSDRSIENHWLKFRLWTYQQSCKIKDSCCQQDQYRNYVYNKAKLFKTKIKYLLKDWSFKDSDANMKLLHVNQILSDQSLNDFMNLHPQILFYIQQQLNVFLQGRN